MTWQGAVTGALERGLHGPLRVLPSGAGTAVGGWLGRRALPGLYPVATARAREALRRLRPDLDTDAALAEAWANVAATVAEVPRLPRFWEEGRIEVRGAEHLLGPRAAGRPVLLAGVHTGNPEVLGTTAARLGARPVGVAVRQPTAFRERVITDVRLRAGGRMIPADRDAMRPALRVLADARETLLFWMDEHLGGAPRGPSLGRGPPPPNGNIALAVRLARRTGCALVPGHATRLAGTRFVVTFLPPVALPVEAGGGAAGVAAVDAAVDAVVRAHLPQWLHLIAMRWDAPGATATPTPPPPCAPSVPTSPPPPR